MRVSFLAILGERKEAAGRSIRLIPCMEKMRPSLQSTLIQVSSERFDVESGSPNHCGLGSPSRDLEDIPCVRRGYSLRSYGGVQKKNRWDAETTPHMWL